MAARQRKIDAEIRAAEAQTASVAANDPARQPRPESAPPKKGIPAIAKSSNRAIVSVVMSDNNGKPVAQGSGFFVSKDGVIVTNYHVISEGSSAVVKLPDGSFYVVDGVVTADKTRDIAVIKAHGRNFLTLPLGNSDRVQVGEEVVAIGNPLSLESTVSNGIVSGIRMIKEEGGEFLQITAPISPGSSGGPLFNMAGEVIGITAAGLKGGENLNFAIPINDAKHMLLANSSKMQNLPNEPEPEGGTERDTEGAEDTKTMATISRYCGDEYYKVWDSPHSHGYKRLVMVVKAGDRVELVGEDGDMDIIRVGKKEGYISKRCVEYGDFQKRFAACIARHQKPGQNENQGVAVLCALEPNW